MVPGMASASASDLQQDLAALRAATARYHNVDVAIAAGYVSFVECVSSAEGTMGIHYGNPALMNDPALSPTQPEILVYIPVDGQLRLVAVEWIKWDADQDLGTDADRPYLFGQPFNGPMLGHAPGMPIHYDLHAWVWAHNPNGMFYDWNPTISCPA